METLAAIACYGGGYSINNVTFLNCGFRGIHIIATSWNSN